MYKVEVEVEDNVKGGGNSMNNKKRDFSVGAMVNRISGTYKKSTYGRERGEYKVNKNTKTSLKTKRFLEEIGMTLTGEGKVLGHKESISMSDFALKTRDKLKVHGHIKKKLKENPRPELSNCEWLDKYGGRYHLYITRVAGDEVGGEKNVRGTKRAKGRFSSINGYILDSKASAELSSMLHRRYYIGDDWVMADVYTGLVSKYATCKLSQKEMNLLDIFDGQDIDNSKVPEEISIGGVFMYK